MFRKLLNKLKTKKLVVAAAVAVAVALPISVRAAWGPSRPVFDWNNQSQRAGSTTGPVFNSFINTPYYGDERNFATASPSGAAKWTDSVNVTPGQDVDVRVYVHNNANQALNDAAHDYIGVAKNTRVRINIPTGTANGFDIPGYISADNSKPGMVYDTTTLRNNSQAFSLSYVPGSARIYNNGPWKNGKALPDAVVGSNGTQIGYDSLNGNLPGCFQYQEVIIIKVHVSAPQLKFTKQVTTPGSSVMHKSIVAKPGDTVSWILQFQNTGSAQANNVTLRDKLPSGATLVPGSITAVDPNRPNGVTLADTALNSGGVNLGNYGINGGGYVRVRMTVNQPTDPSKCEITNVAYARATDVPEQSDTATVTVDSPICHQQPVYSCDLLDVTKTGDKTYSFNVATTAKFGATVKHYIFDFGDGSTPLVTNVLPASHTYKVDGQHVAKVSVVFTVNGEDTAPVTSSTCAANITTGTPVTPATPTQLVNTGPGDVAGIFAAVSLAGAMAYRVFISRRLGLNR